MASLTAEYYTTPSDVAFQSYSLRVVVTSADGLDKEVFMFQRGASKPPTTGETAIDQFVCVADPVDMEEVPVGAPDLLNEMPYYRLNEVTLMFRSVTEMLQTKRDIAQDLADLVTAINQMPLPMETVTYD